MSSATSEPPLLPLRQEIGLFAGPAALDGSPSWTLHDPVGNRFFRLGWPEFEILSRWEGSTISTIVARIRAETTLWIERAEVEQFGRFLSAYDLLQAYGPEATAQLAGTAERRREGWARWLLHNYLFVRIPLFRPDRLLTAMEPAVRWIYAPAFAVAILLTGLVGLYLVARQWDGFLATLVDLLTLQGAVAFALTLGCLKVVHEFGHALTAKRFGCRVPSMGIAFLVLVPVLYTDVNEAWKLTSRGQRLAIGLAGVATELGCAALALVAWGFLPDGPARSTAFLVATSTWVATVLINLSPFMRFDGYYVLSDWLNVPNLHARSFALAQWRLREGLFGFGDAPPEEMPLRRRRFLVAFGFATWIYRLLLFLGIAVIVYHFAFKLAGLVMMAVEIGFFIVRPIVSEAHGWWTRRAELRLNRRTMFTAASTALIAAVLLVPWRSAIDAPSLLKSTQHVVVFAPEFGARIKQIRIGDGQSVSRGQRLLTLASPDIDYKLGRTRTEIEVLEWQIGARGVDATLLARSQITEQEYQAALAEQRALLDQKRRLEIDAPIDGVAVDVSDGLKAGIWMPAKAPLLSVIDPAGIAIEAYVDETDLDRISLGDAASFIAEADPRNEIRATVEQIVQASVRTLHEPMLASVNGGPIPVRTPKPSEFIPERTVYQVRLRPTEPRARPDRVLRGHVIVHGRPISLAARAWRGVLAVLAREGGA